MSRLTISQKAQRVLRFAMGLRSPRAHGALSQHGFTERDLQEGLTLLGSVVQMRTAPQPVRRTGELVRQVDEFENEWFPIVRAVLARHYPGIGELLLANIGSAQGVTVTLTVGTFVERLQALGEGAAPYGADGVAARELLAKRGLTESVIDGVVATLQQLSQLSEHPMAYTPEEIRAVEEAMWAWYLEWSAIARATITSRAVLRRLGFLRSRNGGGSDELEAEAEVVAPEQSSVGVIDAPRLADGDGDSAGDGAPDAVPALASGE